MKFKIQIIMKHNYFVYIYIYIYFYNEAVTIEFVSFANFKFPPQINWNFSSSRVELKRITNEFILPHL